MRSATKACLVLAVAFLVTMGMAPWRGQTPHVLVEAGGSGSSQASPITTFQLGQPGAYPLGVTTDSAGNVWFAEDNSDSIVEFTPANSTFTSFHMPTTPHLAWIWFLVFAGGNLWFADDSQHLLWSFSPSTHLFSNFTAGRALPFSLAYDAGHGRMWFTSLVTDQVGYFQIEGDTAQLARVANVTAPYPGAGPSDLILDGSGNLYVTETFQAKIVELNGSDLSVVRTWQLPAGSEPVGLAMDPSHGRVWFTNHASSYFGYVDLGAAGGYREFPTSLLFQNGTYWVTLPYWIYASPDGSVWFDEHAGNRIARFDPSTLQLTEFPVPTGSSAPLRFVVDSQRGVVWFTEFAGDALGEVAADAPATGTVALSPSAAVLDPAASFTSSGGGANGPPTFSFTGTVTGEAAPSFGASSKTGGAADEVTVRAVTAAAGNYTVAVCYSYPATNQCGYALLTVPPPASFVPILDATYLGLATLGVALVYAIRRSRRSAKPAVPGAPPRPPGEPPGERDG